MIGEPLRNKPLPEGVFIAAIIRGKNIIFPDSNTIIEIGDKVIVFARHDSISEIEKIFSVGIGFY